MHYTAHEIHQLREAVAVIIEAQKPIPASYYQNIQYDEAGYPYAVMGYSGAMTTPSERAITMATHDLSAALKIETMITTYMSNESTVEEVAAEGERLMEIYNAKVAEQETAYREAARKRREDARIAREAAEAKAEHVIQTNVPARKRKRFGK